MIRFNIIGTGFLDFADNGGVGFKSANPHFRFADVSLSRSVEFSIPATDRNRSMLGFGEDAAMSGEMLRTRHAAQMLYDGGQKMGTLEVTAYDSKAFKCVFYIGGSTWIDRLQNLQLSDCPTSFTKGVTWSSAQTPFDANVADPTQECLLVKYDNGMQGQLSNWQLVPSVNIAYFLNDIFTELGIPFVSSLAHNYWMVAGSMNGGDEDVVTFGATGTTAVTLTQNQSYFSVETIDIEWARFIMFDVLMGGGSTTTRGFKASQDVEITFPSSVPKPLFLIRWNSKLRACEVLGGAYSSGMATNIEPLDGRTIEVKAGQTIFFATSPYYNIDANGTYYGWKDIAYPLSIMCNVSRSQDLQIGEVWQLYNNMPDMTLFEFLKSVALATGLELTIDPDTGITLAGASYGKTTDFKALENVISIDNVQRLVTAWGNDTIKAVVDFDSDEYVTNKIDTEYIVDNEQCQEEKRHTSKFSEGNESINGVLIEDVQTGGGQPSFKAKKWTIAYADANSTYLQRIPYPIINAYNDIADNSTCVRVKVAAGEAEFFGLTPSTTFLFRGMAFVWTDADWTDGVLSLTLQRVSQQ